MNRGSIRFKLKLIIIAGALAGIVSFVTGWKFAFVCYMIALFCLEIAPLGGPLAS